MTKKLFSYRPETEEQIRQIKQALRLRMNGEVSENMTNKGLAYKLNYGTLLPELKALAQQFTPDKWLAERLWHLRIRETMILATYLYPVEEFTPETAEEWIAGMPTQEMAEITAMNLFAKLPFAESLARKYVDEMGGFYQMTAWILLGMFPRMGICFDFEYCIRKSIEQIDISTPEIRQKIILTLKNIGKMDKNICDELLKTIAGWEKSAVLKIFYDEISEDLDFYFEV
jgi:hypothetical protein